MERWIIHVDMDEFFAAVEKLDRPELRGKPLLIGGDPAGRGVVATASYEARPFGCRSAMPMAQAKRLCPRAIILPVRFDRYRQLSGQVFSILHRFSPLVEPLSIDEGFLDVTGSRRLLGPPEQIARDLKEAIRAETGLTASVGVAPNKFLAKLASDLRKPDGLVVITPDTVHQTLDGLPVSKLWGVGPATQKQFHRIGVKTIGQVRRLGLEQLVRIFGRAAGEHYFHLASGLDDRPVTPEGQAKSIGQEETFPQDVGSEQGLRMVLRGQVEEVGRRLRRHRLLARTVTLKIRYGDFTTLTRSHTLPEPTDSTEQLAQAAQEIFTTWAQKDFRPLRLLGVTASGLCGGDSRQLSLFDQPQDAKRQRLDKTLDDIADRFGGRIVRRGGTLPSEGQ